MAVDVHCHLQDLDESYVERLSRQRTVFPIIAGYSESSNKKAFELSKKYGFPFYAGIAPQVAIKETFSMAKIKKLLEYAVALGEIGLDYKWAKNEQDKKRQKDVFIKLLDLAHTLDLPVVIHCRNAYNELIDLLKEYGNKMPLMMHSFFGTTLHATLLLEWNVLFSINTVKTKDKKSVIARLPMKFFVTETDCPYIDKNPEMIYKSLSLISETKGLKDLEVEKETTKNAISFFNLKNNDIYKYRISL
ncbi:MAG: TatD family hydrolase [Candidatus Anstonellales archaeon]